MTFTVCAISDTHGYHRKIEIPETDFLICAGDISNKGEQAVVEDFLYWFNSQSAKHKILIFGNHEIGYSQKHRTKSLERDRICQNLNIHYLENSEVILEGLKFYGSPATPFFYDWEWNYQRGKDIQMVWDKIPLDTDVLITHGPAYGTLDLIEQEIFSKNGRDPHQGCQDLSNKISQLTQLKTHVCRSHS